MFRNSGTFLLLACCIILAGCAAQPIFVPLPLTHPASPWACETPIAAQSNTLAINKSEMVPPNPDWQIPGMRDNELHGHAAGQPSPMDMMGHGHMVMHGGAGDSSGHMNEPGMVKMSAPADEVDYAPDGAVHPNGPEPDEHQPEAHLDHMEERAKGYQAAPLAPPMDHSKMNNGMHGMGQMDMDGMDRMDMKMDNMDHMNHMDINSPGQKEPGHDGHNMDNMNMDGMPHEGHNMDNMNMDDMQMEMDAPTTGSAAPMDHSLHGN